MNLFKNNVAAFFDFDYVVVGKDLYRMLGEELIRMGKVPRYRLFVWYIWLLKYRLNLLSGEDVIRENLKDIGGTDVKVFVDIAESIFEKGRNRILPKALDLIEKHRSAGHRVVILSGNFSILIKPFAQYLNVSDVVAIELEIVDGKFTGRVIEPICIGKGKTYWMKKFARENKIDLTESFFYTDSFYDIDTMLSVGNPIAVNPDPNLKKFAKSMGWKILKTL
ncbi:MAG: HAD-IB family hydrolase [Candidatus Calescibacterium sp.]|nr:HAD-IB family hydrolase [Candidatus Calescibacterium sp.]MCX7734342.1 HAD-IB family hydrolase [bacterium]MDW8087613.1 HAD-IB family hydrolase [Candidatus Calescibacterium sp.]